MTDPIEQERQAIFSAFQLLSGPDKAAVKLLAINWMPLGKSQITSALRKTLGPTGVKSIDFAGLRKRKILVSGSASSSEHQSCNPLILELVARYAVLDATFNLYADLAHIAAPLQKSYGAPAKNEIYFRNDDELIRETRLGMYWRDEAYITSLFRMFERHRSVYYQGSLRYCTDPSIIYGIVCSNPFDAEWFQGLPIGIRIKALPSTLSLLLENWRCDGQALALAMENCNSAEALPEWISQSTKTAICRGDWDVAKTLLNQSPMNSTEHSLRGLLALVMGDIDAAIKLFQDGLALLRKEQGSIKGLFPSFVGLFHIYALYQRNSTGDLDEAGRLMVQGMDNAQFRPAYSILAWMPILELDEKTALPKVRDQVQQAKQNPWTFWIGLLVLSRYQAPRTLTEYLPAMKRFEEQATVNGLNWLAAEMACLIANVDPKATSRQQQAAEFETHKGVKLLFNRIQREEYWERALKAISNTAARPKESKEKKPVETRLAWLVSPDTYLSTGYKIEIREQARNAKGGWNKGKAISFKRLRESSSEINGLTEQDIHTISHIVLDRYSNAYYLDEKGWLALAGHHNVFWKDSAAALELAVAEPELRVKKTPGSEQVNISFWPKFSSEQKVSIAPDGLTRLKIVELKPEHHRLAAIIGEGLEAPLAAQERILASLSTVSSLVTIHSDIGGTELATAETVTADPHPRIQLVPEGDGLRIALLVRPFGEQGSYHAPGAGGAGLIAEIGGQRLQTLRDLEQERKLSDEILALCPTLRDKAQETQAWQWLAEDAESSLEVLLELHEIGDKAMVEWPQGEKFKLMGQAGLNRFSVKIQQQRDWFSLSGELKLDNGEIINMQRLLELTAGTRSKFIRLDENRFLALTDTFRKRLDDLRSYSEKHGKDQRLNALALPVIEEIAEEVGEFKGDAAWRKQVSRLRQAEQLKPILPSTLQAELRDYQHEGFDWLSRLASWGVGACLADDMGLGKTLQAIAVILTRAGEGPSLVVAPTSVCFNWQNELARFAPTLNVRFLGVGDRQQLIDNLQPLDLLICSYGLLQQESVGELLASVKFRTIVLDEAQAIKNPATKRSQQAMALQGEFKLITTGTPVENHLGELWNLMRFVNPGLLGSLESFNRRFAGPIERNQDREVRHRLKRLIQPFILRRTKSQVLDELPPRTEIELQVELSEKEATFYEALRRKLVDDLANVDGDIQDKRFQVLAAITKLRRACCNPELVAPGLGLSSSKLELFGEVLDELLENRHKALVFSQFVDHLSIIRAHLDEKGINYQYLDGQTPAPERKKRVEAFQAGQGDVFLISLRAGGVGLNLTAADYVIHMDPWWNPAVEDQASDRAHRIGQQRPVTVYRLVTKGTIEEQIVSLHRQKRDLADSLLEGGEISGKIGAEDLLQLMRGE